LRCKGFLHGRTGVARVAHNASWQQLIDQAGEGQRPADRRREMGDGGFSVEASSIDGSTHLLIEIAGLLHAGRLDGDVGTMARAPRSHPEVGKKTTEFAKFANDQFQDLVALLAALSTKLRATGNAYVQVDAKVQGQLDRVLSAGQYVAPKDR
jgi:hypothetical protein